MKNFAKCLVLICGGVFGLIAFSYSRFAETVVYSQTAKTVGYPEGYRRWVHINSRIVGPESPAFKRYGGLHNIYANSQALEGFKTGKFPDGAVIVLDQLEAQTKNGVTSGGVRRFIDVMQKDSKLFAETGGWGFEEFSGDSHTERALNEQAKTTCFTCHAGQKANDSVFSTFSD